MADIVSGADRFLASSLPCKHRPTIRCSLYAQTSVSTLLGIVGTRYLHDCRLLPPRVTSPGQSTHEQVYVSIALSLYIAHRGKNLNLFLQSQNLSSCSKMKVSLPKSSLKSQNSQIKSRWEPQNRRLFITSLCGASLFLIISFWLNAAWIYGSLYREEYRAKNLEILVIDLDGGDIGQPLPLPLFFSTAAQRDD